ncbi:MAG: DUF4397 domain-containing protein [Chitinophagaceae bacterium]
MKSKFFLFACLSFILLIMGCGKKEDNQPKTSIRLMNASPTTTSISLLPDGNLLAGPVNYLSVSDYLKVNAGGFNVRINLDNSDVPFTNTDIVLDADKNYTIIITDSITKFKKSVIVDNLTDPPAGKAYIRFLHLVGNGPSVDLFKSGSAIFSNRLFNDQASGAGLSYLAIDPGTLTFELRTAGGGSIIALLSNATITAGKIYTVIARGFVGGSGNKAVGMSLYTDK